MKYTECPECGTEIIEAAECPLCLGINVKDCLECNGSGFSGNYYCPHCSWCHEE